MSEGKSKREYKEGVVGEGQKLPADTPAGEGQKLSIGTLAGEGQKLSIGTPAGEEQKLSADTLAGEGRRALSTVKEKLASQPILKLPDMSSKTFTLRTDASGQGLEVLLQE